jgi:hypothetical protein
MCQDGIEDQQPGRDVKRGIFAVTGSGGMKKTSTSLQRFFAGNMLAARWLAER